MTDQQPFEGYTKKIKSLHLTRIIKQSGVLFTNAHDVINVGKETKYQNLEGEWEVDFDVFLFKKVFALFLWTRGIEIIRGKRYKTVSVVMRELKHDLMDLSQPAPSCVVKKTALSFLTTSMNNVNIRIPEEEFLVVSTLTEAFVHFLDLLALAENKYPVNFFMTGQK